MSNNELMHYGVLGMKWGKRRYQNVDGSLTAKGEKRYSRMSDDKLRKTLYKQVRKERARQSGWSNQWMSGNTIGKNSKAAKEKYDKALKEHKNSDSYKQGVKQMKKLDRRYNEGKIDANQYDAEYEKIHKSMRKPELDSSVTYISNGRKYATAYLNKYGKDLNIGYLKDLGYNDKTAKEFTERILRSNKKMLDW